MSTSRALTTFALLILVAGAQAAPVYLDCDVSGESERKTFSVKLDESSGEVTHTSEDGGAFNAKGFFSAKAVSYQRVAHTGGVKVTFQYEINRTTLKVKEAFIAEAADPRYAAQIPPQRSSMAGKCVVVKISGRKI
jgi:hypothetical protein